MIPVYVYALLDDLRVIKICKAASSTLLRSKANIWVHLSYSSSTLSVISSCRQDINLRLLLRMIKNYATCFFISS